MVDSVAARLANRLQNSGAAQAVVGDVPLKCASYWILFWLLYIIFPCKREKEMMKIIVKDTSKKR